MVGISVSLGDFQLACANCYSLENTKLVQNLFVGVKRNESATSALDTNWLVYFLGKLMYIHYIPVLEIDLEKCVYRRLFRIQLFYC